MGNKFNWKIYLKITKTQILVLLVALLLLSCSDSTYDQPIVEGTEMVNFSFLKAKNPSLQNDVHLNQNENIFSGRVSYSADIKNLIGTYVHNGVKVEVDNIKQEANLSSNDFTNPLTYTIKTSKGEEQNYNVDVTYFTGLPIVNINTNGISINSKEDYVVGNVSVDGGRYFLNTSQSEMKIRGRGNSTWFMHPKKPYQLKLSDEGEMLGMPEEKKWIFLAEYSDKTMMRNSIAFEMGYLSNLDWTPQSTFAEVFVNNEYKGTYNISQKVEEGDNRVAIGKEGYLLEIDQLDRLDSDDVFFYTGDFLINIKEPDLVYDSNEFNYVKDLLNEFEGVLNSSQFKDPMNGYAKYIDEDSFIDWYLINEITKNQDSKSFSSIFLNVKVGEKIKMGPLWDFDLAFGNVNYSECENATGFWIKDHKWYSRLFEDESFVAKVKTRFKYFLENEEFILNKMDSYKNQLKWSQQENNDVWNTLGVYVWPNPVVYNTYEEEVNHLKNWYSQRMAWLNNAINNL